MSSETDSQASQPRPTLEQSAGSPKVDETDNVSNESSKWEKDSTTGYWSDNENPVNVA